jgi:hypothetical protein
MRTAERIVQMMMLLLLLITLHTPAIAADDPRVLVELPTMMQDHMLENMRDHLRALDEMLAELSVGHVDNAAQIAETRLGMSSLEKHGAAHLAEFMPQEMRALGTSMHRAASRFVTAPQDAELEPGKDSQRRVYEALRGITSNCVACHQAYRIR